MATERKQTPPAAAAKDEKARRLKSALKANIARRKAQAKARDRDPDPGSADSEGQ